MVLLDTDAHTIYRDGLPGLPPITLEPSNLVLNLPIQEGRKAELT